MSIQNGKKPLSQKPSRPASLTMDDIFGNPMGLDPSIKAACEAKGLAWRFISYTKFTQMGNSHEKAWTPVTRKQLGCDTLDSHSFQLGASPDGLIRRGDLVLAVRPTDLHDRHKAYLKQEALRSSNIQRRHAQELRKSAAPGVKISEGYDEDESE